MRPSTISNVPRAFIEACESRLHFSASVGLQFVGLANTNGNPGNPAIIASRIAASRATNVDVESLNFVFNPADPFRVETALVQQALPKIRGTLTTSLAIDWFPHTVAQGISDQAHFWDAWLTSSPSAAQTKIRNDFLQRIHMADVWAASMQSWAAARGLAGKLKVVVIPVQEDTCGSPAAYGKMVVAIQQQQNRDGVASIAIRRSCLVQDVFRPAGVSSLEVHGPWSVVGNAMRPGDTWSNDGTAYPSFNSFLADEKSALKAGVNALYWSSAFNGTPAGVGDEYNEASRVVAPFAGSSGVVQASDVLTALNEEPSN